MNINSSIFFLFLSFLSPSLLFSSGRLLHEAVRDKHVKRCTTLLENGYEVNQKNRYGYTPLHEAAKAGYEGICILLLKYGANVNEKDECGKTPLHLAAWEGHQGTCHLLIKNKADVNVKNQWNETPLHYASWAGHRAICLLLIRNNANINEKASKKEWDFFDSGYTPLRIAFKKGHEQICKLLLLYGAQFNTRSHQVRKALTLIRCNGTKKLIKSFADRIKRGERPLHWAAENGDQEACTLLLQKGFNIYFSTHQKKTALDFASNNAIKNLIFMYEEIKITGYLSHMRSRDEIPSVVISLIISFLHKSET